MTIDIMISQNKQTVQRYIEGFTTNNHDQILSCLTEDIRWTVYGAFHIQGKDAYAANIEGPDSDGPPTIIIDSMVEEDDVVMAEMTLHQRLADGSELRAAMGEVFVMENGLIKQRRAYVVPLQENDYR